VSVGIGPVFVSVLVGKVLCRAKEQWYKSCAWSKNNAQKISAKGDKNRARAKSPSENVYAQKAPKLISSKKKSLCWVIYFKCGAIVAEWKIIENIFDLFVQNRRKWQTKIKSLPKLLGASLGRSKIQQIVRKLVNAKVEKSTTRIIIGNAMAKWTVQINIENI